MATKSFGGGKRPPIMPNLQVDELKDVRSFRQDKLLLQNEDVDITKPLRYEQALEHVKLSLKEELKEAIEETQRQKRNGVIVIKNKAYLNYRLEDFTEKISNVVYEDALNIMDMTPEHFVKTAVSEMVGYDILDDAFAHPGVSDIYIYQWDKIFVECNGENMRYPKIFRNEKHYGNFIERLITEAEAKFDKGSNKIADFELFENRFCGVNQMVAPNGSSLTIRKHGENHVRMSDILEQNVMDKSVAEFFRLALLGQCSIVYAGITGSGKTTTIRAAVDEYVTASNRRILTCEDTRELFLENAQTLEMVSYKSKELDTSVDLSQLVVTALRLKPKYILIGEVRGN